jgi:hypothetical protein
MAEDMALTESGPKTNKKKNIYLRHNFKPSLFSLAESGFTTRCISQNYGTLSPKDLWVI